MKAKYILIITIVSSLLSFLLFDKEEGRIVGDLSNIATEFDKVTIEMVGYEELGDSTKIMDTVMVYGGKFEYRFSISKSKLAAFTLLKNNKKVAVLDIRDNALKSKKIFFENICLGNELIEINNKCFEKKNFNGKVVYKVNMIQKKEL